MSNSLPGRQSASRSLAACLSLSVWAVERLSLLEAQMLAIFRPQQLAANSASIAASREMAVAVGQLPARVLQLDVENLPVHCPGHFGLTRDLLTMRRIGLSQDIPRAEKRQLRSDRFERWRCVLKQKKRPVPQLKRKADESEPDDQPICKHQAIEHQKAELLSR